ncbi:MAG TPA: hypothetical protein PLY91_10035 [Methanoregulaceae archaeon]|nr:hypothetical protein [Methanoregulaceae archaeon]
MIGETRPEVNLIGHSLAHKAVTRVREAHSVSEDKIRASGEVLHIPTIGHDHCPNASKRIKSRFQTPKKMSIKEATPIEIEVE